MAGGPRSASGIARSLNKDRRYSTPLLSNARACVKIPPADGPYFLLGVSSMKLDTKSLIAVILVSLLAAACSPESGDESKNGKKQQATSDVTFYFGARVIPGDGSPVIEDATFIVSNGQFTAVGKQGEVTPPKDPGRIDLAGRTVTSVFFNLQAKALLTNARPRDPQSYR